MTETKNGVVRYIEVEKPVLGNNTGDDQRLEQALKRELNASRVKIPYTVLRHLPSRLRAWDFRAKAVVFKERRSWRLVDLLDPESSSSILGAALDIGTTRIVIQLLDLETGQELGRTGLDNPQASIGPDVLARIHHSGREGGLDQLQDLVIRAVNENLDRLCREQGRKKEEVFLIAGAGNTAMTHLFLGMEAFEIIKEPYIPCVNIPDTLRAERLGLGIHPRGLVFLFPNIGSYFGGDLLSGIFFADLDKKESPCIMVDVGTNAEIVVGCRDWLMACAGAAGPALEGGMSKMGMTAGPGVIDRVALDPETGMLTIHTIEDKKPVGICGSGMIDLAAALFAGGMIDIRGKFHPDKCTGRLEERDGILSYILVDPENSGTGRAISLSQVDLNSLTSSKAAMYTILEVIVRNTAGLEFEDLEKFYVAGTFGSFIDPESAIFIGMLPDIDRSGFEVLGNSSLGGAARLLREPTAFDRVMEIRESITYIELNVNQEFMNMFSGAKFFPHTDRARFPSVEKGLLKNHPTG
ncbi:ASKHA domain-containing protein [Desulfospira joergensenii]|uniref:ASKHA domain-containing protein n=1 Tax=Desulfospira joergensenii TaxID=53329 RepID=UPI0003B6167C|nr:ASKHA domain-containing protein [Desulfospira joergensenii]